MAISLANIKQYYDEKYDRNNFIKNVVLDNILPGDIIIKARELHFNNEISRVVFLIRIVSANDISAYDVIQNLFPDKNKDFVFNITESDIVLVKEIKNTVESTDLEKLARSIADTLSSEFYTRVIAVSYTHLLLLSRSLISCCLMKILSISAIRLVSPTEAEAVKQ